MTRRIAVASAIWAASVLLSRVVGLFREAALGRILGGGREADVYVAAFLIPDYLNHLLAGGAMSIVFIPIFAGHLARGDERAAWASFSAVATFVSLLLGALMAVLWVAVPWLTPLVAPGFDAAETATLVRVTRIVLPAQAFHVVGGLFAAVLQARDRHAIPALAPLVYNVGIIAGGLLGGVEAGPYGFAWGVVAGAAIGPFLLPLLGCIAGGLTWRPVIDFRHPDLRTYLWRSVPVMFSLSIMWMDDWFMRALGSTIKDGASATLTYAKQILRTPMGVFGFAVGAASYPTISRMMAEGQAEEAFRTMSRSVRTMLVLAFASQVVLIAAGEDLARLIYGGKIGDAQYHEMGRALAILSIALWAWTAQAVLARGFWARGETWLPPVLGTAVSAAAFPLYWALGRRYGTDGLAWASTIAVTTFVGALAILLRRRYPGVDDGYGPFLVRSAPAIAAGVAAGWAVGAIDGVGGWPPLARAPLVSAVAAGVYFGCAVAFRVPEASDATAALARKFRGMLRRDAPPPPPRSAG